MRMLFAVLFVLTPSLLYAATPSFDCAKATGQVEALLCKDDDLAKLDQKMAQVYGAALRPMTAGDQNAERAAQRKWIRNRNQCRKGSEMQSCVTALYESRITELQIKGGLVEVPSAIIYNCGKTGKVTAYFYNNTQIPAAMVNIGVAVQDLAISQPTGSGAQYVGKKLTFWTKEDSALLIRAGKPDVSCSRDATAYPPD